MKRSKITKILLCIVIATVGLIFGACSRDNDSYERLSTPQNLRVEDGALVWDEVKHASGYAVYIENDEHLITEPQFDLSELTEEDAIYELYVIAIGDGKHYSDSDEVRFDYKYVAPEIIVPTPSLKYTLLADGSGYEVSRASGLVSGRIVIPDYYNELPVKRIANDAFGYYEVVGHAVVVNSVTTGVRLPSMLEEIGDQAFTHCVSLTELHIPNSVKVIGKYAFDSCTKLETELPSNLVELSAGAFNGCSKLKSITIPDGVARLEDNVFCYCSSLEDIRFPQNIDYFGRSAVAATKWLKNQPNGIVDVHGFMCGYNGSVADGSEIVISSEIKHICGNAFIDLNCKDITLTISDGITISDYAFYNFEALKSIRLPSYLSCIPKYAFYGCKALESIDIPNGVTAIGMQAFSGCSALARIELQSELEEIGEKAFMRCSALTSIELPSELKEIGENAFFGCSALINLELPQKLEKIGEHAFVGCTKITTLRIPDSVTVLDNVIIGSFSTVIISPKLVVTLTDVSSIAKYYITCSPEENEYDYVEIFLSKVDSNGYCKFSWMKNKNPFYLYVENKQDLPDDGGNYWYYDEDGKTPVIWQVQSDE
ncbi:MAG: leucine-rich repeat domain-containing protein [Clostridiales bacterium]|nr:leucine-rich repeat domain-containing protein [Clostridiales bacterium]